MKLVSVLKRLKDIITSPIPVGGLEISATSLKYLLVKNETIVQASLRLPPGIIERGAIKDRKNLVAALKSLHAQITQSGGKMVSVIVNLPSNLVFTQAFSVPIIDKEHLQESIKLNLQMISPNKIEDSYYDWQEIKINKDLGQLDLLGAFSNRQAIEEFMSVLKETSFNCVAVEFPGLSLARLIRERWSGLDLEQHYLLIYINSEGLLLVILKNGNAYFNHFSLWQNVVAQGALTFEHIKDFLSQELQRVMNFYIGRSGKQLAEAILISPVFNYEIVKLVNEKLGIKIRNLSIAELPKLQPNWFPVLGSGLRGVLPRSQDSDITLTPTNSQTEYYHERTLTFIGLWRNIVIGTLIFIFAAAITVDTLLVKEKTRLTTKLETEFSLDDLKNSQLLQGSISAFNQQLDFIEKIASQENTWSDIIQSVSNQIGPDVIIERLLLDKANLKGLITGRAVSEQEAINFKNRLASIEGFSELSLPLSNLKANPDNTIAFTVSFAIFASP